MIINTNLPKPPAKAVKNEQIAAPTTVVIIPVRRPSLSTTGPTARATIAVPTATQVANAA
jgi:hypothetical protein